MESIHIILSIAVAKRLEIQQMDVKGAYLNGILKETLYMRQLKGFTDNSRRVCHLICTLYGLKQSGWEWNTEFDSKMRQCGNKRSCADQCIYMHSGKDKIAIITIWMDDLLLFTNSTTSMEEMKSDIKAEWEMTDMGEPTKIVSIEITQTQGKILISQKQSIQKILERQGLANASPVQMPLNLNVKIVPNPEGNDGDCNNAFAQILGELQYIATATRPDIAYTVNRLASYTANPSM